MYCVFNIFSSLLLFFLLFCLSHYFMPFQIDKNISLNFSIDAETDNVPSTECVEFSVLSWKLKRKKSEKKNVHEVFHLSIRNSHSLFNTQWQCLHVSWARLIFKLKCQFNCGRQRTGYIGMSLFSRSKMFKRFIIRVNHRSHA